MKSKIQKKKQRVLEDSDQSSDDDLPKVGGLKGLGNIKFDAENMGNFDPAKLFSGSIDFDNDPEMMKKLANMKLGGSAGTGKLKILYIILFTLFCFYESIRL
jgi:hypothetical protein